MGDVWWTLKDPGAAWAPRRITPFLSRLTEMPGARLIKRTMVRTVVRASLPESGPAPSQVIIKVHRCAHLLERVKHLIRPSKAAQEWTMAHALADAGVPTFKPIAFAERWVSGLLRECCLVSEALPDAHPLTSLLDGPLQSWTVSDRRRLLADLAGIIRRLHAANILHNDLHAGNILCRLAEQNAATLYLLDLHATRKVAWVSSRRRRGNLIRLLASILKRTSAQERHEFLMAYATGNPSFERLIARRQIVLDRDAAAYLAWTQRARTARCLQRSSEFDCQALDGAKVHFRRSFPPERIRQTLVLHAAAVAARGPRLLKSSARGCITAVSFDTDARPFHLCVKESRSYGWKERIEALFRGSESRRIWVAANGLRVRGVPACELLAAGERRRCGLLTQSFVIMKALEHCIPLDQYLHPRLSYLEGVELARFKRGMARSLGGFLADLHARQIFHADLKPSNIMVREQPGRERMGATDRWQFVLVDLDRVRFDRDVSLKRRARNLAQLDSAFQHRLTRTDRLRCFRAYIEASHKTQDERRFLKLVLRQSRKLLATNWQGLRDMLARLTHKDLGLPIPPG